MALDLTSTKAIIVIIITIILILFFINRISREGYTNNIYDNMNIYVINLKSRPKKKKFMVDQMNKHGLSSIIFQAIDGTTLDTDYLTNKGIINPNANNYYSQRQLRRGEIGCSLSHILIWRHLMNSDKNYGLIFEDDAILCDNFKELLPKIINEAQEYGINWDIIVLNENCYRHFGKECDGPNVSPRIIKPNNIGYGLYGYIIKKSAIKKYLSDAIPLIIPIDDYILYKHKNGNQDNIFRLKYPIVGLNKNFGSDTQDIK